MNKILGHSQPSNTILCTIDLLESSKLTLSWAVVMAQQLKCHLTILYTYRLLQYRNGEVVQLKKKMEDEAKQRFQLLESEFLLGKGITYDFKTEVGFVNDRIEDHVKKNSLKFLVMNKNTSDSEKDGIGALMDHIHVPVLLVP